MKKKIKIFTSNLKILSSAFRKEAQRLYNEFCQRLGISPRKITLTDKEKRLSRVIPVRAENFIYPLQRDYLKDKLGSEVLDKVKLRGNVAYEALNFVDSRRSIFKIARAVSAEFGPIDSQDVYDFFKYSKKRS